MELVDELTAFMAYCCAVRGNKERTIMGKRQAFYFYHEQWMGLTFQGEGSETRHKEYYVDAGNHPKSWRPLT